MGLYQKIRPPKFSDMVGQEIVTRNLQAQSKSGAWFQVLIFGGMYGCGKTTAARITAMAVNCSSIDEHGDPCGRCTSCRAVLSGNCTDVIEVDGASNTGVDNVRELQEQASYLPMILKKKIFIIDEVHMLSNSAFNSLLKTLEEPPAHCVFILCTTDVEKIPLTIRSRSACYTFGRIAEGTMTDYLERTALKLQLSISEDACRMITRRSDGSMRNALMLLEMVSGASETLDGKTVGEVLGISDETSITALIGDILEADTKSLVDRAMRYAQSGKNFYTLAGEMLSCVTDMLVSGCGGKVAAGDAYREVLEGFRRYPLSKICTLSKAVEEMRTSLRNEASFNAFVIGCISASDAVKEKKSAFADVMEETIRKEKEEDKPAVREENAIHVQKNAEKKMDSSSSGFDAFDMFFGDGFFGGSKAEEPDVSADGFMSADHTETPFESTDDKSDGQDTDKDKSFRDNSEALYDRSAEVAENEAFDFPEYLRSSEGFSDKAREAFQAIRRVCVNERSVAENLRNGFSMQHDANGVTLIGKDLVSLQSLLVMVQKYELPYTMLKTV